MYAPFWYMHWSVSRTIRPYLVHHCIAKDVNLGSWTAGPNYNKALDFLRVRALDEEVCSRFQAPFT